MKLNELKINEFVSLVASSSPAPGGGSVAALAAANGVALLNMVAKLTVGKKKYAEHEELMNEILKSADKLRDRLITLIDTDTEAFNKVSAVLSMPKATREEKSARNKAMQEALKCAAAPPMEVMEDCHGALKLAYDAVGKSNASAASDLGVAAIMLNAGLKGAWLNVNINLSSIDEFDFRDKMYERGEQILASVGTLAEKIYKRVLEDM